MNHSDFQDTQVLHDLIELAYWDFDARRSGYNEYKNAPMSERDAFKSSVRLLLSDILKPCQPTVDSKYITVWKRKEGFFGGDHFLKDSDFVERPPKCRSCYEQVKILKSDFDKRRFHDLKVG